MNFCKKTLYITYVKGISIPNFPKGVIMEELNIIYTRFSTEKQSKGVSIEYQLEQIDKKFNVNDTNAIVISDKGFSGKNINRPGYKELLDYINQHKVNLYAFQQDRLNRNVVNMLQLVDMLSQNGGNLNLVDGDVNLNDANSQFAFQIGSVVAQQYSQQISIKTTAALEHKHSKGQSTGGRQPLGVSVDENGYLYYNDQIKIVSFIYDEFYNKCTPAREIVEKVYEKFNYKINCDDVIYKLVSSEMTIYRGYKEKYGKRVQYIEKPLFSDEEFEKMKEKRRKVLRVYDRICRKHTYLFKEILLIDGNKPKVESKTKKNGTKYKYYRGLDKKPYRESVLDAIIQKTVLNQDIVPKLKLKLTSLIQKEDWKEAKLIINKLEELNESIKYELLTSMEINTQDNSLKFIYNNETFLVKDFY